MTPGSSSLISTSSPASNPLLMTAVSDTEIPTNKNTREKKKEKSNRMVETSGCKKGKTSPGGRTSTGKKTSPSKFSSATSGAKKVLTKEHKGKEYREVNSTSESEPEENEVSFEDYSELCERVAKTMYYVNPKQTCTPRPSLPLTILAVDTFTKYARKDTLEFLDIDMAAEIGRNACVSPTALVFALVYLERLSINNPGYLKTVKPSELFVVSLLVASKFVQDDGEDMGIFNDEWATSANMELKRVNQLELEFLTAIDWRVKVCKQDYDRAMQNLEGKLAVYQGVKRGWFTYSELKAVSDTHLSWNAILPLLYERIVVVVSGICVMYTTFFATLITSSVLAPYLLSVSKLVLVSSITNSLLTGTGSSLSSCPSEDTLVNASIPLTSQDIHTTSTIPLFPPRHHLVPAAAEHLLASIEEQENQTDSENLLGESWKVKQQVTLQQHHHRRVYETGNANFGYSYKCESPYCHEYSQDEALGKVQRVLEKLLQSQQQQSHHYHLESTHERFRCSVGGNVLCAI